MKTGIIFDIKKYAIHDGPGIRTTVFFKGCPLSCWWCHNPESIALNPELSYRKNKCKACFTCVDTCPENAISKRKKCISIDREKCTLCEVCVHACPSGALEIIGKKMTIKEVMKEIEKDIPFYDESNGGVTFSGGEPLMQVDFLNSLLEKCKAMDIHTAVDTSGFASFEIIDRIIDKVDLFLYDLKIIDDEKHKKYTGVSNEQILNNLKRLTQKDSNINIRIPLIPGINNSEDDINKFAQFILSLKTIGKINLLSYHQGGKAKRNRMNKPDKMKGISPFKNNILEETKMKLEKHGLNIKIGG